MDHAAMIDVRGAGIGATAAPAMPAEELERAIAAAYRVALCLTGSVAGAAALLEACLTNGCDALALQQPGARLMRYLLTAHRRGAASSAPSIAGGLGLPPEAAEVVAAIHALPLEERVAVAVSSVDGGSSADAAEALEVSLPEARAHLGAGRRRLRQRLGARWHHLEDA